MPGRGGDHVPTGLFNGRIHQRSLPGNVRQHASADQHHHGQANNDGQPVQRKILHRGLSIVTQMAADQGFTPSESCRLAAAATL